jgi:hypothetical protein
MSVESYSSNMDSGRTTKISSRSLKNVHFTAYPSFSYFSSAVRPSIKASRMREFTGEEGEEAK